MEISADYPRAAKGARRAWRRWPRSQASSVVKELRVNESPSFFSASSYIHRDQPVSERRGSHWWGADREPTSVAGKGIGD